MRYTKMFICFVLFISCSKKMDVKDPYQMKPHYKLLNLFAQQIKPETNLILRSYGINCLFPKNYVKGGIESFIISFSLEKTKKDEISLDYARNLVVFLTENLLQEINSNPEVRPDLDVFPFHNELLGISLYFEDENRIQLGQGVALVYSSKGKIEYQGYKIREYRDQYPALGEHYTIHKESYQDALEIVKKQGSLRYLPNSNGARS